MPPGQKIHSSRRDCAERFIDCNEAAITNKIKIILQMSVILTYGARRPVIRIGRIAGQYSKPRTSSTELVNGVRIPSTGATASMIMNRFLKNARSDPERLVQAYFMSVATLNYIRAMIAGDSPIFTTPTHGIFIRSNRPRRAGDTRKRWMESSTP
jgi:3-deoxy-D-arabino-heptulosonate 7-phosphate (DAHP) synthase class II